MGAVHAPYLCQSRPCPPPLLCSPYQSPATVWQSSRWGPTCDTACNTALTVTTIVTQHSTDSDCHHDTTQHWQWLPLWHNTALTVTAIVTRHSTDSDHHCDTTQHWQWPPLWHITDSDRYCDTTQHWQWPPPCDTTQHWPWQPLWHNTALTVTTTVTQHITDSDHHCDTTQHWPWQPLSFNFLFGEGMFFFQLHCIKKNIPDQSLKVWEKCIP